VSEQRRFPDDWDCSLGKFCEDPTCTSLAKYIVDGRYCCGRHAPRQKPPIAVSKEEQS